MNPTENPEARIEALLRELEAGAAASGYNLNPDASFTRSLAEGLAVNEERYGYRCCPCRLATGDRARDLDIICPCDYRDADLSEWGSCYCALYVSQGVVDGSNALRPVPERRPPESERAGAPRRAGSATASGLSQPVWRCRVCGYLCARETPPERCPVCKASADRFERFM